MLMNNEQKIPLYTIYMWQIKSKHFNLAAKISIIHY